jgi:ABC-2 type transport system permease protein
MKVLTGTRGLVRLALRRDRIRLPLWLAALVLLIFAVASSYDQLYPTVEQRRLFSLGIATNPGFIALLGRPFDLVSTGGFTAWRIGTPVAVLLGLMNLLLIARHTRGEEETGRTELVMAARVGRYAPLAAALSVAVLADLTFVLLVFLALVGLGMAATGAIALGLGLGLSGLVFAALTAVTAQVAVTSRGASGLAGTGLGLGYAVRAAGDAGDNYLTWLSPIGWAQQTRPFAGERWWVLLLPVAVSAALATVALTLARHRDLGAGMLAARPGRARAPANLAGALGLAWRLHRGVLLGWAFGFLAFGAIFGAVARDVGSLLEDNPQLAEIIRRVGGGGGLDVAGAFFASVFSLLALAASGYVIQATLRIRGEETGLRAEHVLGRSVDRWRWALGHLFFAAAGTALILAVAGGAMGLVYGVQVDDVSGQLPRLLGAALVYVPAAWVLGGLTMALVGLAPDAVAVSWAVLGACLLFVLVGEFLELPGWLLDLSPFTHTPMVPVVDPTVTPMAALGTIALALTFTGLVGLRRRDIG